MYYRPFIGWRTVSPTHPAEFTHLGLNFPVELINLCLFPFNQGIVSSNLSLAFGDQVILLLNRGVHVLHGLLQVLQGGCDVG